MKKIIILIILLFSNCNIFTSKQGLNNYLALTLGVLNIFQNEGNLPAPVDIVAQPTLTLPSNTVFDSPDLTVIVKNSSIPTPNQIGGLNVPIGKVYDVEVDIKFTNEVEAGSIKTVAFDEPVTLEYQYNKNELEGAGFLEEFQVFYFSKISNQWEPLRDIIVDHENGKIFAKTDHFTPFILTAVPKLSGSGIVPAPVCLNSEMPIAGSANAVWTHIDDHFKYYRDRNYSLISNQDFITLGFPGAFGIATCNGGAPSPDTDNCGPFPQHKYFNGSDYIKFTASEDIKVYVMYDSRGSQDATWLTTDSWTLTDKQIESTDGVGFYKVYEKQFLQNDVVSLHGNRQGIPVSSGVETNYWVVVKPLHLYTNTCLGENTIASQTYSGFQVSLALAGSNSATFLWKNGLPIGYEHIIVRRKKNIPPTSVEDGVSPNVTEIGEIGIRDFGLDSDAIYYYAFFGRTTQGTISLPNIIKIETGLDTDNDAITDSIETNGICMYRSWHDFNCNSNPTLADTDGDGYDDLIEIINNTKIDSNDISLPVISKFELITKSTTSFPYPIFTFDSIDEINSNYRWTVTNSNLKPTPGNRWVKFRTDKILEDPYIANLEQLTKDFYLWIRDDSGNISNPAGPISITQIGNTQPHAIATVSNSNTIKYSFITPWFSLWNFIPNPIQNLVNQYLFQETFRFLDSNETFGKIQFGKIPNVIYVQSNSPSIGSNLTVINLKGSWLGTPSILQRVPISNFNSFVISEDGRNLYAMNLLQNDTPFYQRINKYIIQTDGSLAFDKRSGPVNQINYDQLVTGKNQTIYATNFDYANIMRVNGETLELMPVSLRSYETYNLRFHPNGRFCYQVNPVPIEIIKLEKCMVNASNGDLTLENNVLTTDKQHIQFEISPDGNYMVVINHDGYASQRTSLVLYKIDTVTGNLTEKNSISDTNIKPYSEFKIDPSSQFIFLKDKDDQFITYIIDHNNEKIIQTNLPFFANIGYYFDIQFVERSPSAVQTNISHENQPGFVRGVNEVIYPLPFTILIGGSPRGQLLNRAHNQPIRLNIQNTDLGYMSCGKSILNFEESFEIKNDLGLDRIQSISGNIWNRVITIQNLTADISYSGSYKLQDVSSNCRPTQPQELVNISIRKKRLTPIYTGLQLPVGQKPSDLDNFTSVFHTVNNNNIAPYVFHTTRCTIHEYGCNLIKIDKPAKVFYCEWTHTNKTFFYYKNKAQCAEKEKGVRRLHMLTLITNIDYSLESKWSWDKFQISDP
ncbi:MAG: beta-propeller fold lactonase family protein [Leptospira bouyouniensis]